MIDGLKDFELSKKMLFYYIWHSPGVAVTDETELAKSIDAALMDIQWTYDLMREDEQSKFRILLINIKHRLHGCIDRLWRSVKQSHVVGVIPFLGCNNKQ